VLCCALAAAAIPQGAAREPAWQGRTIAQWVGTDNAGPASTDVLFAVPDDPFGAIATLGPGSKCEAEALRWLEFRVLSRPDALAAFGERALPILLAHRAAIQGDSFRRAVVGCGPRGALFALDELRGRESWERQPWIEAFAVASPESAGVLASRLGIADAATTKDILECLARVPHVSVEVFAPVAPLLTQAGSGELAVSVLARLPPAGLRAVLEALEQSRDSAWQWALATVVDRWCGDASAIPADVLPVLRRCLAAPDGAPVFAACGLLARWGRTPSEAGPDLLRVATRPSVNASTRAAAFAAMWRLGAVPDGALTALREVFAGGDVFLIGQCVRGIDPLGAEAAPFLGRALALGDQQLCSMTLSMIERMGARGASLLPDLERRLASDDHLYQTASTIHAVAPERWQAVEARLLERAHSTTVRRDVQQGAVRLLVRWSRPEGAALDLFAEVYRRRDAELRDLDADLTRLLCEGRLLAPVVERLVKGELYLQQYPALVPALCADRAALQPAVEWLHTQFVGLEQQILRPNLPDMRPCVRPSYPHGDYARLLGAAGDFAFLRGLLVAGHPAIRAFAYEGLGELARQDGDAARFLIDRLVKVAEQQAVRAPAMQPPTGGPGVMREVEVAWITAALANGGADTARVLARAMFGEVPERTRAILGVLARMGPAAAEAVSQIERLLRETHDAGVASCAQVALHALRRAEPPRADDLPAVLELLAQTTGELEPALCDRIAPLLAEHVEAILDAARRLPAASRACLLRAAGGIPALPPAGSATASAAQALQTALMVAQLFHPSSTPRCDPLRVFAPHLRDGDVRVRSAALQALVRCAGFPPANQPGVADVLVGTAVGDTDWRLRYAAVINLRMRLLTPQQTAALQAGLADDDRFVRQTVREILDGAAVQRRLP
jgi:hypothetical protein